MARRVLITSIFLRSGDDVDRRLRAEGFETVHRPQAAVRSEAELTALLQGVEGIIAAAGEPFTEAVFAAAPALKVVSRTGVGYDGIDVEAATRRGVLVCTTPGVNRHAVAEWAIALMLCCTRKLGPNLAELSHGGWTRHEGIDLAGKTLGIIGLGMIGKEVAQRARAFEMRLLACDPVPDIQFAEAHAVTYTALEPLLRESDLVTLHLFLNAQTHHLINAERLALMKPTAFLINTARGGLVDTAALCEALKANRLAGAALDVFEQEPLSADSPLRNAPNVILSPHVAGGTSDARIVSGATAAENLLRALSGERPLHVVNPAVLDTLRR